MQVWLNGSFVDQEKATVSAFDRGFLFGDGLFETLLLHQQRLVLWDEHMNRLQEGCDHLRLRLPLSTSELQQRFEELMERNGVSQGAARIQLTRGASGRGYTPDPKAEPTLLLSIHECMPPKETPIQWRAIISEQRLTDLGPLSRLKTANKLQHILARMEAVEQGVDEAILCDTLGHLSESCAANLFWIRDHQLFTPPLSNGCLAGVTRSHVMGLCKQRGLQVTPGKEGPEALPGSEGVFLTVSTHGIIEITQVDGQDIPTSPLTKDIQGWFLESISHAD